MLRRLAALCLALVPLISGCGPTRLLTVGAQRVIVEPNADSDNQRSNIPYTVGMLAHVTISLIEPTGERLTLRDNDRSPDTYSFPFSGVVDVPNSSDKRVLPDGSYQLVFEARTAGGQSAEQTVHAVIRNADPAPLDITDLQLSLPTFEPNGQGVREVEGQMVNLDQTVVNYSISKSADVSMWVADASGNVTPIQAWPAQEIKPGLQTFTWDGKGPSGVALKNGTYTLYVQGNDASGNVTQRTTTVTIENSGTPQVQIVSAKFFPTALGLGGVVNVEVTVKNVGDVPIKTLGPPPGTKYSTKMTYLDPSFNRAGDISPPYVEVPGRWRIGVRWTSSGGQWPARWGFFADENRELQPGEQVTVNGSIRIEPPQPHDVDFWATVEMGGIGFTGDYGQTRVHVGF